MNNNNPFETRSEIRETRVVYIMRGPPGSGKSYFSSSRLKQAVRRKLKAQDLKKHVLSTDNYFMVKKKYIFNADKLSEYHTKNMDRTESQMVRGVTPLFIDNTNIDIRHIIPYFKLATKHDYQVLITNMRDYNIPRHNEIWVGGKINRPLLLKRAQERRDSGSGKDIPDEVIHSMCDLYEGIQNGVVSELNVYDAINNQGLQESNYRQRGQWGRVDQQNMVRMGSGRQVRTERPAKLSRVHASS